MESLETCDDDGKAENVETSGWLEQAIRELGEGPVIIEREGQPVGVLVPPDMIELLERLDDVSYRDAITSAR